MKILLLEESPSLVDDAVIDAVSAGHQIVRCHDEDESPSTCRALRNEMCPLDVGDVEVAVVLQDGPGNGSADDGARCALRRHIPVVLAGRGRSAVSDWVTARVDRDQLIETVEMVAHEPSAPHSAVAEGSLLGVLENHGCNLEGAKARVMRSGNQLRAFITAPHASAEITEIAAVRVAGALRRFDPFPRTIDVIINDF